MIKWALRTPEDVATRLRISGGLIIAGMLVMVLTFFWLHPISFILFIAPGALLAVLGVGFYLLTVLRASS